VQANKTNAMPAGMWKSWIDSLTSKGVKPAEVEWSGVKDFLALQPGKVSKADVVSYLDANGVQVQETVLGLKDVGALWTLNYYIGNSKVSIDVNKHMNGSWYVFDITKKQDHGPFNSSDEAKAFAEKHFKLKPIVSDKTKYKYYQLPGGENYRELLLTLPIKPVEGMSEASKRMFGKEYYELSSEKKQAVDDYVLSNSGQDYQSSHWDTPNVLAHLRVSDRTDATGAKTLLVDEIQSDFAQDTRKAQKDIKTYVNEDFKGIIRRMKAAGVLEVECD